MMQDHPRSIWRLGAFLAVVAAVFTFDCDYFLPCRCWYGAWERYQGNAAVLVLALVGLRYLTAWAIGERNDGWKHYMVTLIASPLLVQTAFDIAKLALPADLRVALQ